MNRKVWVEQMIRVREGQDPIGILRAPEDDGEIRITSDNIGGLTWDEGMKLLNMTQDERSAAVLELGVHTNGRSVAD
jgi:hypothetical protein